MKDLRISQAKLRVAALELLPEGVPFIGWIHVADWARHVGFINEYEYDLIIMKLD